MRRLLLAPVCVALTLAPMAAADAQHGTPAPAGGTASLQGSEQRAFLENRYVREFYALSVVTLGPGAPPVDVKAYEAKSYALFRAMGGPAMEEHLKLIPRQVIQIVKEDPKVLDSFEAFGDAMVGPK